MSFSSPNEHSERMRRVRGVNTKPELMVRRLVWATGWRYRLHGKTLPGKPDLVFTPRKKVIFVHGCFWHAHEGCPRATVPKTRVEFWMHKLKTNKERDARHLVELRRMGWRVLVVWECELRDLDRVGKRILRFLGPSPARSRQD